MRKLSAGTATAALLSAVALGTGLAATAAPAGFISATVHPIPAGHTSTAAGRTTLAVDGGPTIVTVVDGGPTVAPAVDGGPTVASDVDGGPTLAPAVDGGPTAVSL